METSSKTKVVKTTFCLPIIKPLSLTPFCLEKGVLFNLVAEDGFEPPTLKVWTSCSSQLSYSAILVDLKRLELLTPWMQIRCFLNWAIDPVRNCLIMIVKIKCFFNILFIKCPTWVYKHLIFINRNINMRDTF